MIDIELVYKIKNKKTFGPIHFGPQLPVSIDSRKIQGDEIFVAIKGERFDGIDFVPEVLEKGCPCIVLNSSKENIEKTKLWSKKYPTTSFVIVEDTVSFLQELAQKHLSNWKGDSRHRRKEVIALTGSSGKTTTKEMLVHMLDSVFPGKIHFTKGNFNNHIGLPLTILSLTQDKEAVVLEMGTNHFGEIKKLCDIARPTAGLITNIGSAHLEFFETKENIFLEKSSLYEAVKKNTKGHGKFVVSGEDKFLKNLGPSKGLLVLNTSSENSFSLNGKRLMLTIGGELHTIETSSLFGEHIMLDLALSLSLLLLLYPKNKNKLIEAATNFKLPSNNRGEWKERGGKNIYLDAYNANPESMKASLMAFKAYLEDKGQTLEQALFIIGDMNELGLAAHSLHEEVGSFLKNNIMAKNVCFVGRYAADYAKGLNSTHEMVKNCEELKNIWSKVSKGRKYIFIKGSRSLQLESVLDITNV